MKHILFILTFILFSLSEVIYPQLPTIIYHVFDNQFGDGSSGKLIKVRDSNRNAPYTHSLNQSSTSTYHAFPVANQTVVYNSQSYKQEFYNWLTSGQTVNTDEDFNIQPTQDI